jgi:enoyl-CoA hydratase
MLISDAVGCSRQVSALGEVRMSIVLDKRANGVAWVTIDRPKVLNALDVAAKERLGEIWQEIAEDSQVRVAVLTGAGAKAFCAGSDLKEIARTGKTVPSRVLLNSIPGVGVPLLKPVIAAMHGYCLGMGMTLALHCDLRLASRDTRIGYPEVQHGLISALSAIRLPQAIPRARAMEILLMPRDLSADDAKQLGLINDVVDDVQATAAQWASTIAGYAPRAVQATKRLALFSQGATLAAEQTEVEAARAWVEARDDEGSGIAGVGDWTAS